MHSLFAIRRFCVSNATSGNILSRLVKYVFDCLLCEKLASVLRTN